MSAVRPVIARSSESNGASDVAVAASVNVPESGAAQPSVPWASTRPALQVTVAVSTISMP